MCIIRLKLNRTVSNDFESEISSTCPVEFVIAFSELKSTYSNSIPDYIDGSQDAAVVVNNNGNDASNHLLPRLRQLAWFVLNT